MSATVRIDASRFQRLLTSAGGPGNRFLARKAERVADLARVYAAGHGSISSGIEAQPVVGKSVKVLSSNVHTVLVHNGSRRHKIRPIGGRRSRSGRGPGYLRFEIGGRVVYAREVDHPGYKGDDFLTRALRNA